MFKSLSFMQAPRCLTAAFLASALAATGCITPKEKKDIQTDIFGVQTRLLTIERELADTSKETKSTGDSASKRIASTKNELDRLTRELQQLRGEVDALRVGVVTGQLPGAEVQEGSIAATLAKVNERLEAIEATQDDLLEAIAKAGVKKNTKKPADEKKSAGTLAELQDAFDAKRFKQVAEDAPKLLKQGSAESRQKVRYLLAESHFRLGQLREAALRFNELLESKPAKAMAATAKMRLGDSFRQLGDTATAKIYYDELIREFPNSDEASKARERLAEVGGSTGRG